MIYINIAKKKEICDLLSKDGYTVIEYHSTTNIVVTDCEGYKYKINKCNYLSGRTPSKWQSNPYAIDNLKLYLKLNCPEYILLDNKYSGMHNKLRFICTKHLDKGVQLNTPNNIIYSKHICKYCGYAELSKKKMIPESKIIKACKDRNLQYIGRNQEGDTYVQFICDTHKDKGIQLISWDHLRLSSKGCPYCAGKYRTTQDFIKEVNKINDSYEVLSDYKGVENSIKCRCNKCKSTWVTIARSLLQGSGCPICKNSKGEQLIKDYLYNHNIEFIPQKKFSNCKDIKELPFDFYLPFYNMAIEYDGEQHFFPVDFDGLGNDYANKQFNKTTLHDRIKNEYCLKNNITLIRIPYYEIKNINNILNNKINKCTKSSTTAGCI